MRVPQGADAHLVVGLDAVVQLGGLPVPDVQLPVGVSRHHVTGERWKERREEKKKKTTFREGVRTSAFQSFPSSSAAGGVEVFQLAVVMDTKRERVGTAVGGGGGEWVGG